MRFLPVLLAFLITSCAQEPPPEIARFEAEIVKARVFNDAPGPTLAERMEELGVPGMSVAVFKDGELAWARAYGMADVTDGRAATTETLFQAASISKPVAATAMHDMVEDGVLDLDADINDYLQTWQLPDNEFTATEKVTLRRIVNHTAGTTVWGFPGYARTDTLPTTAMVLDGLGNTDSVRVYKMPGESWQYSGGGYTIMQLAMADAADQPFPDLVHERVLEPAGMIQSGYWQPLPDEKHAQAAAGYRPNGSEVEGKWHVYPEMAAAGLWTTPTDLARWAMTIQADLGGAGILLDETTARDMVTPGMENHGLGPGISSDSLRFGHGGANEGYRTQVTAFLDGRGGIAVMTNSDNGGTLAQEVMLTVAREYGWPGFEPVRFEIVPLSGDALRALEGDYRFPPGIVTVSAEDSTLALTTTWDQNTIRVAPLSETEFVDLTGPLRVQFEMAEDGSPMALSVVGSGARGEKVD